jgi:hypothetical protein
MLNQILFAALLNTKRFKFERQCHQCYTTVTGDIPHDLNYKRTTLKDGSCFDIVGVAKENGNEPKKGGGGQPILFGVVSGDDLNKLALVPQYVPHNWVGITTAETSRVLAETSPLSSEAAAAAITVHCFRDVDDCKVCRAEEEKARAREREYRKRGKEQQTQQQQYHHQPKHAAATTRAEVATDNPILIQFDTDARFGPKSGITRLERWQRAQRFSLDPPPEVLQLITADPRNNIKYVV